LSIRGVEMGDELTRIGTGMMKVMPIQQTEVKKTPPATEIYQIPATIDKQYVCSEMKVMTSKKLKTMKPKRHTPLRLVFLMLLDLTR